MTIKHKILLSYIKDLSVETPDAESLIAARENIPKYSLKLDLTSEILKNKMIEVNTKFKFEDKEESKKKSYFEIIYSTIIKISEEVKDKKELEKIILCDVQIEIYPDLEKTLLDLLHNSGYPGVKFEKKVDFEGLYKQKFN